MLNLLRYVQKCPTCNTLRSTFPLIRNAPVRQLCKSAIDVNTNVAKDVILFKHDNDRFFKFINIFALCQFGFWTYLSNFAYTSLRDAPVSRKKDAPWWQKINLGENKYRNTLTVLSFAIGWGILAITWMYSLRSVKYLILRKGGKMVTIVTFTPLGKNRMLTLGLENISCKEQRTACKAQLPIKVKGHYLHYILDMRGEFKNATLFDHTAGLKRKFHHRL